jgi:hypothetical protein
VPKQRFAIWRTAGTGILTHDGKTEVFLLLRQLK